MNYVIGIDGGGTKTTGVIANARGETFAEVTVGATNPNSVGKEQLKREFTKLFNQLQKINPNVFNQVCQVFAGLSGAGHLNTQEEMKNLLMTLLPAQIAITVDNDAITALYSGTLGEPGIVQIAGTGAITFGMNSLDERKRVGGWGYLFSDHGSGYSVGRDALQEIFLAYDGLQKDTLLTEKICRHFDIHHLPDLIPIIYHREGTREVIALLSQLVMEAADEGDEIAMQVITDNGKQLARSIAHLYHQLFHDYEMGTKISVILVGGLFNRLDLLKQPIGAELALQKTKVNLIKPTISPVGGAVIAALKTKNITPHHAFIDQFIL